MFIKTIQSIEDSDLNELVTNTYGRLYDFQQQDDCKDRGVEYITVPCEEEDYENDTVDYEKNEMGVSFAAWLARDPKQKLGIKNEYDSDLTLFWQRNFYPHISMVANDLHAKGLLPAGEYQIVIDW